MLGCPKQDSQVAMGDVNGDGQQDVVMVTPSMRGLQIWYGDRKAEIIVGAPGKDATKGMLVVLRGSASGVSGVHAQVFRAADLGLGSRSLNFGKFLAD